MYLALLTLLLLSQNDWKGGFVEIEWDRQKKRFECGREGLKWGKTSVTQSKISNILWMRCAKKRHTRKRHTGELLKNMWTNVKFNITLNNGTHITHNNVTLRHTV